MKYCSYCGKEFSDDLTICPTDQQPLVTKVKNEHEINFKKVEDYSPEELKQFREVFAAVLKQYQTIEQRYAHLLLVVFLIGFAAIICGNIFPNLGIAWLSDVGVFCFVISIFSIVIIAFFLLPKLQCPACHNLLFSKFGKYCPECGSPSLEPKGWLDTPHCNSCGKDLRSGKGRNFKYKTCTQCGVFLDDKGL